MNHEPLRIEAIVSRTLERLQEPGMVFGLTQTNPEKPWFILHARLKNPRLKAMFVLKKIIPVPYDHLTTIDFLRQSRPS